MLLSILIPGKNDNYRNNGTKTLELNLKQSIKNLKNLNKDDIEIGNIVNPLGTCIDVGFGLERIEMVLNNTPKSKEDTLRETVFKIIESGFEPGNNKQGYILKKLLRICNKNGVVIEHQFYEDELIRQEKILTKWNRLKDKHQDKPKDWWWDTHGIDLDLINI